VRNGQWHRGNGPAYRSWTVQLGTGIVSWDDWYVNGKLHRVDGPACDRCYFCWQSREVRQEDLPWLRRGRMFLAALATAWSFPTAESKGSPAWTLDADHRVPVCDTGAVPQCRRRCCVAVRVKNAMYVPVSCSILSHCHNEKVHTEAVKMEETEEWWNNRRVIHRAWRNTRGHLHRTTGPAVERWTVLPGGGHVLSCQVWYVNGKAHREGRPAGRRWHVAEDGSRVLGREEWWRRGILHRSTGPSYREWTVGQDGAQTLVWEVWRVQGKLHRVDGPALDGRWFAWHGRQVIQDTLRWLRRGHGLLTAFTGTQQGDGDIAPAWSRDARVKLTGASVSTEAAYRSAVGGVVFLSV